MNEATTKIKEITKALGINKSYLANLVGVTENTLSQMEITSIKYMRIDRLHRTIRFLKEKLHHVEDIKSFLENKRVSVNIGEEDNTVSLMTLTLSDDNESTLSKTLIKIMTEERLKVLKNEKELIDKMNDPIRRGRK